MLSQNVLEKNNQLYHVNTSVSILEVILDASTYAVHMIAYSVICVI